MKLQNLVLSTLFLGYASEVCANEPPPVPEGGINFYYESPCFDNETGEKGMCYLGTTATGETYLTFFQNGELMFIRQIIGDDYIVIWVNDLYMGV